MSSAHAGYVLLGDASVSREHCLCAAKRLDRRLEFWSGHKINILVVFRIDNKSHFRRYADGYRLRDKMKLRKSKDFRQMDVFVLTLGTLIAFALIFVAAEFL